MTALGQAPCGVAGGPRGGVDAIHQVNRGPPGVVASCCQRAYMQPHSRRAVWRVSRVAVWMPLIGVQSCVSSA